MVNGLEARKEDIGLPLLSKMNLVEKLRFPLKSNFFILTFCCCFFYLVRIRSKKIIRHKSCTNPFFLPTSYEEFDKECTIAKPNNYSRKFFGPLALWTVQLSNLGTLDKSNKFYDLHLRRQRWARVEERGNLMYLNPKGGTAARSFTDNFEYAKFIRDLERKILFCRSRSKSSLLDMGAGVGSLAAVFKSMSRNMSGISVFSYVLPDDYLRLSAIHAERGIQTMLYEFKGKELPFPKESFQFIHCRFCWHHVVGYDIWLNEVNRLLAPGGYFIFTFVPRRDEKLLPQSMWQNALHKQPWKCFYTNRIIQICSKGEIEKTQVKEVCDQEAKGEKVVSKYSVQKLQKPFLNAVNLIKRDGLQGSDYLRLLNINCQKSYFCFFTHKWFPNWTITSTYSSDMNGTLRKAIASGYPSFRHDWRSPGPFYPRTFDVINLMCEKEESYIFKSGKYAFFLEMSRLLQPDGYIILLKNNCPLFEELRRPMKTAFFKIVFSRENLIIAKRLTKHYGRGINQVHSKF